MKRAAAATAIFLMATTGWAQIREKQLATAFTQELIKRNGSVAFTGNVDIGGFKITNAASGTAASDYVTKSQLDAAAAGLDPKAAVRAHQNDEVLDDNATVATVTYDTDGGTSGNGQLTGTLLVSETFTVDGVAMADNDRLLVTSEGLGTAEVHSVDTVADVGGNLGGDYWVFYQNAGSAFYVWYDVDNGSVDPNPSPPAGVSFTEIEVDISSGATAATVATNTETAINASAAQVAVSRVSNALTITNDFGGNVTNVADGASATGFTFGTDTQGTGEGADANGIWVVTITGTSLTLDRATDFDTDAEVSQGAYTFVTEGTSHGNHGHILTTGDPITVGGPGGTSQTWETFSRLDLGTVGEVTTVNGGDAAAAGTSGNAAHADHQHAVATAAAGTITPDASAAEGTSTSLSRADHAHAIAAAAAGTISPDDASAEGVSTSFSRADHAHAIAAATAGTISPDDAAQEGVASSFSRSDHQHAIAAAVVGDVGTTNAEGASSSFARADHTHDAPALAKANKRETPSVTTGEDQDTGLTIASTPALDSYVMVEINGVTYKIGDGVDTECFYYADPGAPTTPVSISAIKAADKLIFNGTTCGFNLDTTDRVSQNYLSFTNN